MNDVTMREHLDGEEWVTMAPRNRLARIAYQATEYGQRLADGTVNNLGCGPKQAALYAAAGHDIVTRQRVVYCDDVTAWYAMPATACATCGSKPAMPFPVHMGRPVVRR